MAFMLNDFMSNGPLTLKFAQDSVDVWPTKNLAGNKKNMKLCVYGNICLFILEAFSGKSTTLACGCHTSALQLHGTIETIAMGGVCSALHFDTFSGREWWTFFFCLDQINKYKYKYKKPYACECFDIGSDYVCCPTARQHETAAISWRFLFTLIFWQILTGLTEQSKENC